MRSLSLFSILLICAPLRVHVLPSSPTFIDPTGTYILKGVVIKNNITGHFGELRIRLLDKQTAAFCFYLNSGYPDFVSGALMDTLKYDDNRILYRPVNDSSCFLILTFNLRKVDLMEVFSDPHSGCGFAPGVVAPVTFDKISSEVPVIQDLSTKG